MPIATPANVPVTPIAAPVIRKMRMIMPRVAPIVLRKPATLRLGSVRGERGHTPRGDVRIEVREGEDAWRPLLLRGGAATLRPGTVELRASDEAGLGWTTTLELGEGQSETVEVLLTPR